MDDPVTAHGKFVHLQEVYASLRKRAQESPAKGARWNPQAHEHTRTQSQEAPRGPRDVERERNAYAEWRKTQPYQDPLKKIKWGLPDLENKKWTGLEAVFVKYVKEEAPQKAIDAIEDAFTRGYLDLPTREESYHSLLWFFSDAKREHVMIVVDAMLRIGIELDEATLHRL
eukprot:gene1819-2487_t